MPGETRREKQDRNDDDEFVVLNVAQRRDWLNKTFGDISKASVGKQVAIGAASGWCSGYVFGKVGKAAAGALGGSLLLLTVAHHQGLITIHWGKMENNVKKARKKLEKDADNIIPVVLEEVKDFFKEHMFLAGGFAGGFLLGMAT